MLRVGPDSTSGIVLVVSEPVAWPQTCVASSMRDTCWRVWKVRWQGAEDFDCRLTVQQVGMTGFGWRYIALLESHMDAAMPLFLTDYQLETTVDVGSFRQVAMFIGRYFPGFLIVKLACLGSPCTEAGMPGFHSDVPADRRPELLALSLAGFLRFADIQNCSLHPVKDLPEMNGEALARDFSDAGLDARVGGAGSQRGLPCLSRRRRADPCGEPVNLRGEHLAAADSPKRSDHGRRTADQCGSSSGVAGIRATISAEPLSPGGASFPAAVALRRGSMLLTPKHREPVT